jgi:hypothetical protein
MMMDGDSPKAMLEGSLVLGWHEGLPEIAYSWRSRFASRPVRAFWLPEMEGPIDPLKI